MFIYYITFIYLLVSELGASSEKIWTECQIEIHRASDAHCMVVLLNSFQAGVQSLKEKNTNPAIIKIMKMLCDLFALFYLEKDMSVLLEEGYLNRKQAVLIRNQVRFLLGVVRRDAIPLVDAFNISDAQLNSAIGRYDGKAYEVFLFDF